MMNHSMKKMSEAQEQATVIEWALYNQNRYPELKLLHHIPNGGRRDARTGAMMKRQGVKAGVPDLHLPVSRGGYHSLYIEMKTAKGRARENQNEWIQALNEQGNLAVVCHGAEEAIAVIKTYLNDTFIDILR